MREIDVTIIKDIVSELCIDSNICLPPEILEIMEKSVEEEKNPLCRSVLIDCIKNAELAKKNNIPICQDTGMVIVFLEIGQEVHFTGGDLYSAINDGIANGYTKGRLRLSVVNDPFIRENTENNSPSIIHTQITSGEKVKITLMPKGFGSENMSRIKMFNPSDSIDEIIGFITQTVKIAGSNPCPPIIVGVGIGGDFEYSAYLSKKALCRNPNQRNPEPFYSEMEKNILAEINKLGIGAQGFGGEVTALSVNIEQFPTHIAGLPVAVNISCHATRHIEKII